MKAFPNIVILGAGGATGLALVDALAKRGARPRVMTRDAAKAPLFAGRADVVTGDLADRESLRAALAGADVAHYIPPVFCDREEEFAANVLAALQAAGVARLTYHSVLHAPTPAMPHHRRKSMVELMLRESPLEWTILQPAMYMQTPFSFFDREADRLSPPFDPDRPFNPIDLPDLVEATANILLEPGHEFATYELAGTERLDCRRMAAVIAEATGRPVGLGASDAESFARQRAKGRGFDERQTQELLAMYRHYDGHGLVGNGKVLTMLLGRDPHGFAEAARRAFA